MVQALARVAECLCRLLPSLVLVLGLAGYLLQSRAGPAGLTSSEVTEALSAENSELLQIDNVLARRLPDLGFALRRRVAQAILEEARKAQFDPLFVLGLIEVESSFSGEAVSVAGARGLMQLLPGTLEYLASLEGMRLAASEIWRDPALQVRLGVRYLSRLEKRFHSLDLALMAYNAGPESVRVALEAKDSERFSGYVRAVRFNHARFRKKLAQSTVLAKGSSGSTLVKVDQASDMALMP